MAIDMNGDQSGGPADRQRDGGDDAPPVWRTRTRSLVNRLTLAEETALAPVAAPAVVTRPDPVDGVLLTRSIVRLVVSLLAGFAGGVILVASAPQWWLAPPNNWRFTLPGIEPGVGRSSIYF